MKIRNIGKSILNTLRSSNQYHGVLITVSWLISNTECFLWVKESMEDLDMGTKRIKADHK